MKKPTLKVETPYGTFKRQTFNDYKWVGVYHADVGTAGNYYDVVWSRTQENARKGASMYRRIFIATYPVPSQENS